MRSQRGVVLINALVVVLVIASVTAALLARSEAARSRAASTQNAQQIAFHLDAMEDLAAMILAPVGLSGAVVHPGDPWAVQTHVYDIGAGQVRGELADLQGRLNINWLAAGENAYVDETFRRLFVAIDLPAGLVAEIRAFLAPGGPRDLPRYLRAPVPTEPRGGPLNVLDELKLLRTLEPGAFDILARYTTALPPDTQLNLNTAPMEVLRAALHPLPTEVQVEYTRIDRDGPIDSVTEVRNMTIEILETEAIEGLPFDRFTVSSQWFQADLAAELNGQIAARRVILRRFPFNAPEPSVRARWSLRD